ncbi:MAG: response regulator transcription factor [Anaerolineales bacterium]|nr:response regulator transcription factor [Anaerolineales bacterium]MCB9127694.1 response regulator transcription factor [Ardenticatenales bacterium]
MGQQSILVVEDEPSIREVVALYLEREGYDVATATNGNEAMAHLESSLPDLVILDLMLPEVSGESIARWLRTNSDTPIIMLTARKTEADRVAGLDMGADDYVTKPFSTRELVSRVKAVLRRTSSKLVDSDPQPLEVGHLQIDPKQRTVMIGGKSKSLTATEFDLLWVFARHPRQVFTRDQLLDLVWGLNDYIDASTVTVHIRRLREKIEEAPSKPRYVQTVWGVGYKFEP